ncbi:MAG: tetratricopeptide repeat protein, partial [Selenomonadaceae bacterium]|nr:tetratricopeptide repeat protein [Selenomonadaceae bacterium]
MEDNETLKDAQEVAYKEAMRSISQQVAVYVKSKSQAEDFQITDDVVELISTSILKVEEKKFIKEIMPDGKLKIKAFVSGTLDESATDKALNDKIAAFREKKRYDESLAEHKEQQRQRENAEKEYNNALRNTSAAILEQADALYKSKDYSGAVAKYTEIIERHPTFANAYVGRGNAYFELKQYDKASKDFQKA